MSVTIDASVGTPTANAYLDIDPAQAIFDGVPNTSAWDTATDDQRSVALVYATTMLDAIACKGVKYNFAQSLNWPRGGVLDPDYGQQAGAFSGYMVGEGNWGVYLDYTLIPKRVQRATAMLALEILRAGTADVWNTDVDANKASKSVDTLHTQFIPPAQRRYGLQVYRTVWRELYPLTLASEARGVERA